MFAVFPVVQQLHELLWHITEALDLAPARPVHRRDRSPPRDRACGATHPSGPALFASVSWVGPTTE